MANIADPFGARARLNARGGPVTIFRLDALERAGLPRMQNLPYSIRILLEAALRNLDGLTTLASHVEALARWSPASSGEHDVPFMPARVLLQDFTGVPALADLAAMRTAMARLGGDPRRINPHVPADLVIDHSVQVDYYSRPDALALNARLELERNRERYEFLRWGQRAFDNLRVVPPATGIVHQVNLEYLAKVVLRRECDGDTIAMPDTLVGTDSHTTMINGLGVLGWGVGGIEAEAALLGQAMFMLAPKVVGFRLSGRLRPGTTATDLVLRVTEMLRKFGVVGAFVEFFGPGLRDMGIADRATIGNMAPEYGATVGFFPVDDQTLAYLRFTGRTAEEVDLVERYCKEQMLFRTDSSPDPRYSQTLELDLSTVEPSLAGPRRPQDRIALSAMKSAWRESLSGMFGKRSADEARPASPSVSSAGQGFKLRDGAVVIAALTSCTNTSNPALMLAAGLLAKKAVQRGLRVPPWVKTSLAPGSRVVTDYFSKGGLTHFLDELGFQTVGYGCTTCIGNSGPLPAEIAHQITAGDLVVASVLSGNRNFEARIHPLVRANFLASPPLVVAYALAGTIDIDLTRDALGRDSAGRDVYLRDIWPAEAEIQEAVTRFVTPDMFKHRYADVFTGDDAWRTLRIPEAQVYEWREDSTYIQEPPFFENFSSHPQPIKPLRRARCLALLGDSVTTDHISPAGSISPDSPAGRFLLEHGVTVDQFNSYGSRRGNDRVMTRGTFANVRLRNLLAPGTEGGMTVHLPSGQQMSIYDAATRYRAEGTPLIVLAGADYGMGSSRDWAAKGTRLLGVRTVIAVSFERIHRTNLVCMGVLPLEFASGATFQSLGLTGHEIFEISGLDETLQPRQRLMVSGIHPRTGRRIEFATVCRLDTPVELEYYRNGGVLQTVLRRMTAETEASGQQLAAISLSASGSTADQ